jgi:hypothetical protein
VSDWRDRAVQAWRRRQADLQCDGDATGLDPRDADPARQRDIESVPEHLRAAYEWMDGGADSWHDLEGQSLIDQADRESEAAGEMGYEVPAEAIVALAEWLRRNDSTTPKT